MGEGLNRQSVIVMIILSAVTLGFYIPYWLYKRTDAFNYLNSRTKITKISIILLIIVAATEIFVTILLFMYIDSLSISMYLAQLQYLLQGIYVLLLWIISLGVRRTLSDHTGQNISLILTLLFTIFYLQYRINALIDVSQEGYSYQNTEYDQY